MSEVRASPPFVGSKWRLQVWEMTNVPSNRHWDFISSVHVEGWWSTATTLVRPNKKNVFPAPPLAGRYLNGPPTSCTMPKPYSKWFWLTYGTSNLCKRVLIVRRCILSCQVCFLLKILAYTYIPTLVEMISINPTTMLNIFYSIICMYWR